MKLQNWTPFVDPEHLATATATTTKLVNPHKSTTKQTISENKISRFKNSLKDDENSIRLPKGLSKNENDREVQKFSTISLH